MTETARSTSLTMSVADILRRAGTRKKLQRAAVLEDLAVTGARVPEGEPVALDLTLESLNEGVVATGEVRTTTVAECRRCLTEVRTELVAPVLEVFEAHPTEGETQPLVGENIDLEPVVREAVLLELPLAPLCREDCAGLCPQCGADRNVAPCGHALEVRDDRWAALDALRLED